MKNIAIVGRIIATAYDDHQQVRIASMNRIRDIIRKKILGIPFDVVEEKKDSKSTEKKFTDTVLLKKWNELLQQKKISVKEHKYIIKVWDVMLESKKFENRYKTQMKTFLKGETIYNEFLNKVRGIGEVISVNLIKEFGDCMVQIYKKNFETGLFEELANERDSASKFNKAFDAYKKNRDLPNKERIYKKSGYSTISQLWAHSGNSVINGVAPRRKKGEAVNYNPKLRTLTWKISDSLLKQNKGYYRQIYDTEKQKQLNRVHEEGVLHKLYPQKLKSGKDIYPVEATKLILGHAHNRALRKMRKIFLDHYWFASRELAGLSTQKNYVEGVLEHVHITTWKQALKMENTITLPKKEVNK